MTKSPSGVFGRGTAGLRCVGGLVRVELKGPFAGCHELLRSFVPVSCERIEIVFGPFSYCGFSDDRRRADLTDWSTCGALSSRNANNKWNAFNLGNFTQAGVTHYSFAHLAQQTTAMSVRLNYTLTRDISFEMYGQPFVAKGTYSDVRELSATPDADSYAERFKRFTPPAGSELQFKVTELIANSVVRWEYRPGSTVFFVWQHGRQGPGPDDRFNQSWTKDYSDIFKLHPDNTFLIKVAYWLSR